MADAYTGATATRFDQAAYDLRAWYALRPELYADAMATVKPTMQSFNGSSVQFNIQSDLSAKTTTLSESTDFDAVVMADSQVVLTLAEYGNAVITTALARGTTYIPFDPVVANTVGFNAGLSLDTVAMQVLSAGTNISYSGGFSANGQLNPTSTLAAADVRKRLAALRRAFVQPINGYYVAMVHPDVSFDLRSETGNSAVWRDPHTYSDPSNIWNGEVGVFEGFRFIESPRCQIIADAGSSTTNTDVYQSLFLGQEALAKAHSMSDGNGPLPTIVPGPVTDHLRRLVPMGWYWLGAYGVFRQAALRVHDSASSIGLNAASGTN